MAKRIEKTLRYTHALHRRILAYRKSWQRLNPGAELSLNRAIEVLLNLGLTAAGYAKLDKPGDRVKREAKRIRDSLMPSRAKTKT